MTEAAHDIIYIINKDFQIDYVNNFAAKCLKKDAVEVIGKKDIEIFPPEIAARHKKNLEKVLSTGESLYYEAEDELGDKKMFLGTWLSPIFDDKKKVVAVLGISRDITFRKNLETQLAESEKTYHSLVDSSLDALVIHDGGKIIYVNQSALKMLGTNNLQKIIGRNVMDFVHSDSKDSVKKRIETMLSGEKLSVPFTEEKFISLDGTPIDVEVGSVAIFFKGVKAFQVIARDLRQKKNIEEERKKNLAELEKINKYLVGRELKMRELKKEIAELKK